MLKQVLSKVNLHIRWQWEWLPTATIHFCESSPGPSSYNLSAGGVQDSSPLRNFTPTVPNLIKVSQGTVSKVNYNSMMFKSVASFNTLHSLLFLPSLDNLLLWFDAEPLQELLVAQTDPNNGYGSLDLAHFFQSLILKSYE